MQKITFVNNQAPALNANNLNQLQTNIENAINDVANDVAEIIESGTNANGDYVKYSNGTMICTKVVTGSVNVTSSWGNCYTNSDSNVINLGNFAETFTETPNVQITGYRGTGGYNYIVCAPNAVSTSSAGKLQIMRPTSQSNVGYNIHITAIGKWK